MSSSGTEVIMRTSEPRGGDKCWGSVSGGIFRRVGITSRMWGHRLWFAMLLDSGNVLESSHLVLSCCEGALLKRLVTDTAASCLLYNNSSLTGHATAASCHIKGDHSRSVGGQHDPCHRGQRFEESTVSTSKTPRCFRKWQDVLHSRGVELYGSVSRRYHLWSGGEYCR